MKFQGEVKEICIYEDNQLNSKGEIVMNIIIHRGTHQIGGSCIELSTEKNRIILDIGQELPNIDEDKPNKISVLPRIKGLYKDDVKSIDAVLISHGHGDHVGLIGAINSQIPIFIGEKALRILNVTSQFTGGKSILNPMNYFKSGKEIIIGDFSITPYLVDHSGFDAYAFVIKADNKCIVYTGDLRDHGRKKKATDYFINNIPNAVDALLIEGTMMSRLNEPVDTEENIEQKAYNFMKSKANPMFVLQSSTNIDRLVGMYKAAKRNGRIFVIDIFTAHIVAQLDGSIPKLGDFRDVRVFYPYYLTQRMFKDPEGERLMKQFNKYWISRKELGKRNDYCMIIRESMLSDLQHIPNIKDSGFIYSMWSGYKKREKMKKVLNYLELNNIDMIDLHTSGHASIDSLQKIIYSICPKKLIPIHTENPNLFAEKFENVHIAKDEEIILV